MSVDYYPNTMVQCFNSEDRRTYIRRIEKVKFGVPLSEAFIHDIPATLLVLLLKVNKQGPVKKDIWRAPGNQSHVRKLIHIMQHGRLVNIDNFSVYTAASVIKKFLCKIPNGVFGPENEDKLFEILNYDDADKQREAFCRIITSLPVPSQHLLVLLFGTFRLITDAAETFATRMTPEAIGVSVAPSLFHSCIHDGQRAKIEDVVRFRSASKMVTVVVQNFGYTNLFPRENYEFYARITGRTLRIDENWHFTFQYPARAFSQPEVVVRPSEADDATTSSFRNLSKSIDVAPHNVVTLEEVQYLNSLADSTKSLSYLEWVHERQTARMQSRSEWFLKPVYTVTMDDRTASSKRKSWRYHYLRPKRNSIDVDKSSTKCPSMTPSPKYLAVSLDTEIVSSLEGGIEDERLSSHI